MLDAARKMMPLIMMKMANPSMVDRERRGRRALLDPALADRVFPGSRSTAGRMIASIRVLRRGFGWARSVTS